MRMERPFGIGDPRNRGSEEIVDTAETFNDAVQKWELLQEAEPRVGFYITGWGAGTLADARDIRRFFANPRGTYECPVCGLDRPHTHTPEEIEDNRKFQAEMQPRRDVERAEISMRAERVAERYGMPRKMVAADIGLEEPT